MPRAGSSRLVECGAHHDLLLRLRHLHSPCGTDFTPTVSRAVRQAYARTADQAPKAQARGELVQKYGHEDWIEPLLDELGPIL